jgi:hypothetical protein
MALLRGNFVLNPFRPKKKKFLELAEILEASHKKYIKNMP